MKRYEIDETGIALIRSFEGQVLHAYKPLPTERYWTIGVGHYGADVHAGERITASQSEQLLRRDVERVCMAPMRAHIHVPLNINRIRALASATFNCGPGFLTGTVGARLNRRDYAGAAQAFHLWEKPAVLVPRRHYEAKLFMTPVKGQHAPPVHLPWLESDERRWCDEYDRLLKAHKDVGRRRVLRRYMHERAVDIHHAALTEGGWERAHRRQRFHSLAARTS